MIELGGRGHALAVPANALPRCRVWTWMASQSVADGDACRSELRTGGPSEIARGPLFFHARGFMANQYLISSVATHFDLDSRTRQCVKAIQQYHSP